MCTEVREGTAGNSPVLQSERMYLQALTNVAGVLGAVCIKTGSVFGARSPEAQFSMAPAVAGGRASQWPAAVCATTACCPYLMAPPAVRPLFAVADSY